MAKHLTKAEITKMYDNLSRVSIGASFITEIEPSCDCGDFFCRMLGTIEIASQMYAHVTFIAVTTTKGKQEAVCAHNKNELKRLQAMDDAGEFRTMQIPSLPYDYLFYITPPMV